MEHSVTKTMYTSKRLGSPSLTTGIIKAKALNTNNMGQLHEIKHSERERLSHSAEIQFP